MSKRQLFESLPTEAVHPAAENLDLLAPRKLLDLLAREDRVVVKAVHAEAAAIERAAKRLATTLLRNGRVFYVGAGTSGRLGVLEAAECPPTFGTDPDRIVAIIAGGPEAVFRSKEGAEDRADDAWHALRRYRLDSRDLVIGISASSVTPFVRESLVRSNGRGAGTILVTCGPRVRRLADVVIAPAVGPELLAGSTRMKAGTATKLVLNQVTLLAMIRIGKVFGPHMVDLRPGSRKLRDRALRIIASVAGVDRATAETLFVGAGRNVKTAVVMGRLAVSAGEARARLARASGDLRAVLE
ncbi:MAG TPA: N-acetylmuramic acid 6-phosphate etherase [Vicinamibacteria bacterium]|nr:N-acetylmuramic acid 6-phosphate etherase [Vicinamibacteria bacterium]